MNRLRAALRRRLQHSFQRVLPADVKIDGPQPHDPHILDERFYEAVGLRGTLGLGESYMNGWWDCPALDRFFEQMLRAGLLERFKYFPDAIWVRAKETLFNGQSPARSRKSAHFHYNLGNDLFESFLDPYNQYTCAYFKNTDCLNCAQERKLDLICRKLQLNPTDSVLDIGCGWGGFAKFAAERYGCRVTGISISEEQINYARDFCRGLTVEIRNCDYRAITGSYDKVLICGMIEHVGHRNYRKIMQVVRRCLRDNGLFLLHTIGKGSDDIPIGDPWLLKYIFPGGMLPTPPRIACAIEGLFDMVDFHEFGAYYDPTLMGWHANFQRNWPALQSRYDERFGRMWRYYLLSCAAHFRARKVHLWQFVFRPRGGCDYESVR